MNARERASSPAAEPPLPQLHQVAAMTLVYRKLVHSWAKLPLLVLVVPLVVRIGWAALDAITGGFALVSSLIALGISHAAHLFILSLSPKDSLQATLEKNHVRIPLFSALIGCSVARWAIRPVWVFVGIPLLSVPFPAYTTCVRLALAMALLGLAVVWRYIGRCSIMRCSSVPVIQNPLDAAVADFWKDPTSVVEPSDRPGELLTSPAARRVRGRRLQHWTWKTILQQMALAFGLGSAVAYFTVFDWFLMERGETLERLAVSATCGLTVAAPVFAKAFWLDFVSHELDPKQCMWSSMELNLSSLVSTLTMSLMTGAIAPAVSIVTAHFVVEDWYGLWGLYFGLAVASSMMSLYLQVVDNVLQLALFNSSLDLKRLVEELYDDETPLTRLDVILHCLLYDSQLIKTVSQPSQNFETVMHERDELIRASNLSQQLARILLSPMVPSNEAPLEEDVFRLAVLESLGGRRGAHNVTEWVHYAVVTGSMVPEPPCLPLLRALCIYIGGLGETLIQCANPTKQIRPTSSRRLAEYWSLPPGCLASAEYAVKAAALFIVQSMTSTDGRLLRDWKSTHVALLVPTVLQAIFHLRTGLVDFGSPPSKSSPSRPSTALTPSGAPRMPANLQLQPLVRECDAAATRVLHSLKIPKGLGRVDLHLDEDCHLWTKSLVE